MSIRSYLSQLEGAISSTADKPLTRSSLALMDELLRARDLLRAYEDDMPHLGEECPLTESTAKSWAAELDDGAGSTGPHWTLEQSTSLAADLGADLSRYPVWAWWLTLNMVWTDYHAVGARYGVDSPAFYGALARAWLEDPDGPAPMAKLGAYYACVVP